jgi:hypothetical protein
MSRPLLVEIHSAKASAFTLDLPLRAQPGDSQPRSKGRQVSDGGRAAKATGGLYGGMLALIRVDHRVLAKGHPGDVAGIPRCGRAGDAVVM